MYSIRTNLQSTRNTYCLKRIKGHGTFFDELCLIGNVIDGVTVVKIYEDRVEFKKDGKRWTQKEGDAPDPAWR